MKRLFGLLAVMLLLAGPASALGLGAMVSGWSPDRAEDDIGGGVKLELNGSGKWDFEFRTIWFQDMATIVGGEEALFTSTVLDFGGAYNFIPDGAVNPYLGAGGSYFLFDLNDPKFGEMGNEAGWYVEGGLELGLGSNWVIFGEVFWREVEATIKGNDLGFSEVEEGRDLQGFSFNLGLMFTW